MRPDRWHFHAIFREANRNVFSWRSKMAPLLVLAILLGTGSVLFGAWESQGLKTQLADLQMRGRGVITFTSLEEQNPTAIGRSSCEALSEFSEVERAGSLYFGPKSPIGSNSSVFVESQVTRDIPQIGPSIWLFRASNTLIPELRDHTTVTGSAIAVASGSTRIVLDGVSVETATLAKQPEGVRVNSNVVLPMDATITATDTCIAVLAPFQNSMETMPKLAAYLSVSGGAMTFAETLSSPIDPVSLFLVRSTQYLAVALGILGAVTAFILNQLRASEFAAYRMSGTSARSLTLITTIEHGLITAVAAVAATATTLVVQNDLLAPIATLERTIAGLLIWWAAASITTLAITLRKPSRLAKDR